MRAITVIDFIILFVLIIGWVLNIIKVQDGSFDEITVQLVLRVVGIFFVPLGAVMGYI